MTNNDQTIKCPLCNKSDIRFKEKISGRELNTAYLKLFKVEKALISQFFDYVECRACGLMFFHPMETGEAELYEVLQKNDWYYMSNKEEYAIALKHISVNGSLLEVGSGKAAFAQMVSADRYTGLEFNDKAIERAKEAGINLIKESVEQHAAKGNTYDNVVSFQVLEHVSSPAEFVKGCVECMKPGGNLVLAVPSHEGFAGESVNNILNMPPHHVTHWTRKSLESLADLFQLQLIKIEYEPLADYHKAWARQTQLENTFRQVIGLRSQVIDSRLVARILSRLAKSVTRYSPELRGNVTGHTVIASYKKPG